MNLHLKNNAETSINTKPKYNIRDYIYFSDFLAKKFSLFTCLRFLLLELVFNSPVCQFCKSKLILALPGNLQLQVFLKLGEILDIFTVLDYLNLIQFNRKYQVS